MRADGLPTARDLDLDSTPDWLLDALCSQIPDDEMWFPSKGGTTRPAKRICQGCPVREPCLQMAFDHDERYGIWGGLSERDRRKLFASGWRPGDPIPDVRITPPIVVCPDCGKGVVRLPAHRWHAHGVGNVA